MVDKRVLLRTASGVWSKGFGYKLISDSANPPCPRRVLKAERISEEGL
jgi:hypothetical protein